MAWHDDPDHPFAGIAEKLKRADQNIVNLQAEIKAFVDSGEYPAIPNPNDKMWQEAVDYHRNKRIPLRFSVLAGEIVHQLRSSLDHVVWHFSSFTTEEERIKAQNSIEFPVFQSEPVKSDEIKLYNRKIRGIKNTRVLGWIKDMQPYQARADAANQPLLIVHNMDRFDKHRELVIVDSIAEVNLPPSMSELYDRMELYTQGKLLQVDRPAIRRAIKDYAKVTPAVAFREFGERKTKPVIAGLLELFSEISTLVAVFATEV